jgi:hypothetical protein
MSGWKTVRSIRKTLISMSRTGDSNGPSKNTSRFELLAFFSLKFYDLIPCSFSKHFMTTQWRRRNVWKR